MAAYRDWGLITSTGGRITLTDLARRIAMTEENEDAEVLREAFFTCDVFRGVYDECAKGQAIDTAGLERRAVLTLGVNAASGARFVESFVASAVAAGLARRTSERFFVLDTAGDTADAPVEAQAPVTDRPRLYGGGEAVPLGPRPPIVLRQEWRSDDAVIALEIRSTKPLPSDAFVQIAGAVTAVESVARTLGVGEDHV